MSKGSFISKIQWARLSGLVYLILIVSGVYGLVYVPAQLIDWQSPATTVANIQAHGFMFRLGVVSQIICFTSFVFLPLMLYKLFETVNRDMAVLMVVLALVSVPTTFSNIVKYLDVLTLLQGHAYLAAIPQDLRQAEVMQLFASFNNGTLVSNIFWGAWLFPLGFLVFTSRLVPKIIGIFLMLGSLGYQVEFMMKFVWQVESVPWFVSLPSVLGEFGVCLWLLLMGVKESPQPFAPGTT